MAGLANMVIGEMTTLKQTRSNGRSGRAQACGCLLQHKLPAPTIDDAFLADPQSHDGVGERRKAS